jgi:predicted aspartyl protease
VGNRTLCLCMAAFAIAMPSARAKHANDVPKISFQLVRNHLIVASGKLGQISDRNLLIDTGANPTVVDQSLAYELGLKPIGHPPGGMTTIAGVAQAYYAIRSLDLGPIHRAYMLVAVANLSLIEAQAGLRIDAIVGLDAIVPTNFQIDYLSKKIGFGDISMPSGTISMTPNTSFAVVEAQLNGTGVNLMIDTGSSQFVLFRNQLPESIASLPIGEKILLSNVAGDLVAPQVQLQSMHIGRHDFSGSTALLATVRNCCKFQGMLGISSLHFRRVSFDFKHRLLGLELPDRVASFGDANQLCPSSFATTCQQPPIPGLLRPR